MLDRAPARRYQVMPSTLCPARGHGVLGVPHHRRRRALSPRHRTWPGRRLDAQPVDFPAFILWPTIKKPIHGLARPQRPARPPNCHVRRRSKHPAPWPPPSPIPLFTTSLPALPPHSHSVPVSTANTLSPRPPRKTTKSDRLRGDVDRRQCWARRRWLPQCGSWRAPSPWLPPPPSWPRPSPSRTSRTSRGPRPCPSRSPSPGRRS